MQNPFIFSDRELPPLEENTLQIDDSDKHHMKMGSKVEYCFSSLVPTVEPLPQVGKSESLAWRLH